MNVYHFIRIIRSFAFVRCTDPDKNHAWCTITEHEARTQRGRKNKNRANLRIQTLRISIEDYIHSSTSCGGNYCILGSKVEAYDAHFRLLGCVSVCDRQRRVGVWCAQVYRLANLSARIRKKRRRIGQYRLWI